MSAPLSSLSIEEVKIIKEALENSSLVLDGEGYVDDAFDCRRALQLLIPARAKQITQSPGVIAPQDRYENLGGVYFPILQQDGERVMIKVGDGKDAGSFLFLRYLRQHDRQLGPKV